MKRVKDLFSMKGKTALVTGGAGLLGRQIAEALAEQGAHVVIASRDIDKCQATCDEIRECFPETETKALQLDLIDKQSIAACIDDAAAWNGGIDILVVCAWSGQKNDWDSINDKDWDYDIEVCLNGVYRLIKKATDELKKSQGVVLTIGSMYGHVAPDYRLYENVPQANPPSYGAAKAGVIQLTRYLASFLAPYDIRINCISPGPFPFPETISEYPEFAERLCARNPMGRLGLAHEIKGAAVLLCSDASSYMTGQNICIDGGWTVW
jgi:NAD(P)-dependent dehydrogenase (short-subunit alcohol dehydrogenase family)